MAHLKNVDIFYRRTLKIFKIIKYLYVKFD
jgi:hypothetical protein